jgi:hypothetical protein
VEAFSLMSATLSQPRAVSSAVDEYVANGVAAYLQQIRAIRNTGIEAIFRLGKVLIEAKAQLAHGALYLLRPRESNSLLSREEYGRRG